MATKRIRQYDCETVFDTETGEIISEYPAENFAFSTPRARSLKSTGDRVGSDRMLFSPGSLIFTNMKID